MSSKKANKYHPSFKFRVVLESFTKSNVSEVARKYEVNASQLSRWRSQFAEKGSLVFQSGKVDREKHLEKKINQLENLIGKKEIEINVLKKYLDFYSPPDGG